MQETWGSQGWEDPLEEGMATHSSILAWRIPMDGQRRFDFFMYCQQKLYKTEQKKPCTISSFSIHFLRVKMRLEDGRLYTIQNNSFLISFWFYLLFLLSDVSFS